MRILKPIETWEEWTRPASPDLHWKEGRSAMELAKAFFRKGEPQLPKPLASALKAIPVFSDAEFHEAIPELTTSLPPRGSAGPRNHDVWLRGTAQSRRIAVGVEAKADEEFDEILHKKYRTAVRDRDGGASTMLPERCAAVVELCLGRRWSHEELDGCELRYQLFSGVAGTLIQAAREECSRAAFIVYEFASAQTDDRLRERNQRDYDRFLAALPASDRSAVNQLRGPIPYTRSEFLPRDVELWIGKVEEVLKPE
jgi:hypothetical protein